ncbi:MAG: toll/interleukin-1 receptor domain-containing protein [Burkholderiaceae bacterium]
MREIFISYRRADTEAWANHLYDILTAAYGAEAAFMDRRGNNIPWGADWQATLESSLQGCAVLLALMGPQWLSCERAPGQRRLDTEDDWVRNEILAVLARGGRVVPVLFQGAAPPSKGQLPDALVKVELHNCQARAMDIRSWPADVTELLRALDETPRLAQLHRLRSAGAGFRSLGRLMAENLEAAQAVGRSRQMIENADREISEMSLLKGIHDAFHEIEGKCLIPIRSPEAPAPRLAHRRKFVQKLREIRGLRRRLAALGRPVPPLLSYELNADAKRARLALRRALRQPSTEHHVRAVNALETMLGQLPTRLNDAIAHAARLIELEQLQKLMQEVVDLIGPVSPGDRQLPELQGGIEALGGLRQDLDAFVQEHGWLQSLDNLLRQLVGGLRRAGTGARMEQADLQTGWNLILTLRRNFSEARTPSVRNGDKQLASEEPAIAAAVEAGDEARAAELLADYANDVGELFRTVDAQLKEFSTALRTRTESLKLMLRVSQQALTVP